MQALKAGEKARPPSRARCSCARCSRACCSHLHLRYVLPSGPVERFVTFLDMQGHSGRELAGCISITLFIHADNVNRS